MNRYYATIVTLNAYRQYVDRTITFDAKSEKNARMRVLKELGKFMKGSDFNVKDTYVFQLPKGIEIPGKVNILSDEFKQYRPKFLGIITYDRGHLIWEWTVFKKGRSIFYRLGIDGSIKRM